MSIQTLDRNGNVPLHVQLRDALRRQIVEGVYQPGQVFPTEREFAETFHVSRTTIREALNDLVRLGYLTRQQGKGTFVARTHDAFDAARLSSFSEDMARRGQQPGSQVLSFERATVPLEAREHLGDASTEAWRIVRVRFADEEPIALQMSYLPAKRFPLEPLELHNGSLYALLKQKYGIYAASADEIITAEVAPEEEAQLLGVAVGAPLLCVERFVFSQRGEAVEYAKLSYRADSYKFYVHQHRGG